MNRAVIIFLFFIFGFANAGDLVIPNNGYMIQNISIKSWKTLRDFQVVKQNLDYSCGAASIATILNEYYGKNVTEEDILNIMDKKDMRASFGDMADALKKLGFRGVGYAASFEQITKLKIPVIVYTKHRKNDHFSVLRGINKDTVWIADPSLGNRTYSQYQFLEMWETRENSELKGKILAIIPLHQEIQAEKDFFSNQPRRQTVSATLQQAFRNVR